jgi:WD40 repeat protein/DNA-binding SARP family transcriptional activator
MRALDERPPSDVGSRQEVGTTNMDVQLLGPVEVVSNEAPVALGGPKQRALLAMLALEAGSTVSVERLIDGLWGDDPPTTAPKLVQLYVSHLRKAMAGCADEGAIATRGGGYELRVGRDRVDASRFERLLAQGAAREALSLWRGPPLANVAKEPFAAPEIRRLDELRTAAVEVAIDQDLEAGRHREVLPELESLLAREPLRERLHAQRMLALYRSGRQADALEAYRQARATLIEQIGVEPGPELRRLQDAILRQDPSLDPPAQEPPLVQAGWPGARTPLLGRDPELERLRRLWRRARGGAGAAVVVMGARGMGKTRLAHELAHEIRRDHGDVLRFDGDAEALRALTGTGAVARPTLLVLDDLDAAGEHVQEALRKLLELVPGMPVLALATASEPVALPVDETLTLEPLAPDAVASVARLYTGAHADAELPVERLVAESGGVPARLHRAAAEWARTDARRRLGKAAARTSAERAGWQVAEDDVVAGVVELQVLRERTDFPAEPSALPVCPFKGLASFEVDDAGVFFGRERLVADMVARLPGTRMMGVVGPSGSGKSSAVRAGLLAALADGVLPESEHWPLAVIRPGHRPLEALERAIAELPRGDRWVVAVDQFEETFTACRDESERAAFVDRLVRCARDTRRRTVVIVAVRADFYGHCAGYTELSRMLGANHVLVGPMRRHELRRAIELPARRAGLHVEPDLVEALIADVEGEPGGLPLLSTALLELWRERDGRRLHLAAYERTGGVRGAVARLAEAAYDRLEPAQREQARRIMLRLAGDGGVRARVPIGELDGAQGDPAGGVLSVLAADRLITIGEGEVEVAHEALLREWPRLRGWLEEDADGRRLHRQLTHAARDWDAAGRDPSGLYRGARLAAALDWVAAHDADLNTTERGFLDASRSASERAQRRLRAGLAGVASLLILAVIAGLVALNERGNARDEALAAAAQRVGAQALVEDDLDRSLLLARQGMALDDSLQTQSNLLAALLKSPAAIGVLRGDGDRLISLDLSPDQRTLAFIDHDGTLSFVDRRTRRPVGRPITIPGIVGVIIDAASVGLDFLQFSPDGSRLAVGGGKPVVLDARTHRSLFPLRIRPEWFVYGLRFSNDGRTIVAAVAGPPDWRPTVQSFDARSGRPLGAERQISDTGDVTLLATRGGRRLVTTVGEGPTIIRDAHTLRPLRRVPSGAEHATLSPDERTLLVGYEDGSVRFLDLVTGDILRASGRHDGRVVEAVFTADGRTAVSAGADGRLIVWDVKRATAVETLEGHAGQVTGMAITRDGATLYTAALDGKVLIWDLSGTRRLGRPFNVGRDSEEVPRYALSPDGRVLAIGRLDGTVVLFDTRTLREASRFAVVSEGPVRGMGYVPGGRLLIVGGDDGFLALVDPRSGTILKRLPGHRDTVFTPSFSADGRLMATASGFDTVRLYALPSGRPVGRRLRVETGEISLSPDGRMLAITRPPSGRVEIRDVPTLRPTASLPETETVWDLAEFTPDGRYLVGGSFKGWVRLWSTETWKPASRRFTGHAGRVEWQSMSPDGRTLATGGPDGTVRLWDLPTQQPLGAPLPGRTDRYLLPQFTPDGAHLFAIATGRAYRWDVRPASWARLACSVAGRNLTRSEWQDALPERDYDPAC